MREIKESTPETKQSHNSTMTVAVIDYDGCGVNLDNSVFIENEINRVKRKGNVLARREFQDYISRRIHPERSLQQLDYYISKHNDIPVVKTYLEALKPKVNSFLKKYYQNSRISKSDIQQGYREFNSIFEELTTHLFMGQLFKAGYQIGDPLTLINGSARQTHYRDHFNHDGNHNGLLNDALPKWKEKLSQYTDYFPYSHNIHVNMITSADKDDNTPRAIQNSDAPKKTIREVCKLGLLLSQMHCMARLHPNRKLKIVAFDDRYDPVLWERSGGTHNIEKSMTMISENPEIIPRNVTFKAVGFDSNYFFHYDLRRLKAICGNLGDNGCVQGTGPTRNRNFTDRLLKRRFFSSSVKEFNKLLNQSRELMRTECYHEALMAPSQPTGCVTILCQRLGLFSRQPPSYPESKASPESLNRKNRTQIPDCIQRPRN